jgi:hypothetical protein
MLEVNAHIITKDHFLFKYCHGPFWSKDHDKDHERDGKSGKGKGKGKEKAGNGEGKGKAGNGKSGKEFFSGHRQKILTLCRKHNRMEYGDTNITLLMQLGCGFFTYQEWAHVIPKLHDEISGDGGSIAGHTYQGSHLCHNGRSNGAFCSNIFCLSGNPP